MSYSHINDHPSMVFDHTRNKFYLEAMQKVVASNSVVMDLGSGLGVHGIMALQQGAQKVYFIEPSPVVNLIAQVIKASGVAGTAITLQNKIEDTEIDEKFDVIISVFTGNFLLTEDLLPSLFFARDNYLKPGGHLIPEVGIMEVVPVSMPDYYEKNIDCWLDSSHDLNYQALRKLATNSLYYDTPDKHQATFLASFAELFTLDFMTATEANCNSNIEMTLTQDGLCHGWLGWFKMGFDSEYLSTSPEVDATHWRQVFLPLEEPIQVKAGERITFNLNRPEFGEWTWTTSYKNSNQRHSTFNSQPICLEDLQKKSPNAKPLLGKKGKILQAILPILDGSTSSTNIISHLRTHYPNDFKTQKQAEEFISTIKADYC